MNRFTLFDRMLSVEASKADASRHYGFYIDGDIAKLPGGMDAPFIAWLTIFEWDNHNRPLHTEAFFELNRERALASSFEQTHLKLEQRNYGCNTKHKRNSVYTIHTCCEDLAFSEYLS